MFTQSVAAYRGCNARIEAIENAQEKDQERADGLPDWINRVRRSPVLYASSNCSSFQKNKTKHHARRSKNPTILFHLGTPLIFVLRVQRM
jgi:hypothetical protein